MGRQLKGSREPLTFVTGARRALLASVAVVALAAFGREGEARDSSSGNVVVNPQVLDSLSPTWKVPNLPAVPSGTAGAVPQLKPPPGYVQGAQPPLPTKGPIIIQGGPASTAAPKPVATAKAQPPQPEPSKPPAAPKLEQLAETPAPAPQTEPTAATAPAKPVAPKSEQLAEAPEPTVVISPAPPPPAPEPEPTVVITPAAPKREQVAEAPQPELEAKPAPVLIMPTTPPPSLTATQVAEAPALVEPSPPPPAPKMQLAAAPSPASDQDPPLVLGGRTLGPLNPFPQPVPADPMAPPPEEGSPPLVLVPAGPEQQAAAPAPAAQQPEQQAAVPTPAPTTQQAGAPIPAPAAQQPQQPAPQEAVASPAKAPGNAQVLFTPDSAELTGETIARLEGAAEALLANDGLRVQLLAYAKSADGSTSAARRLSLSRALAVRSYLIDKGIKTTRFVVRAQGAEGGSGPSDRVDVIFVVP